MLEPLTDSVVALFFFEILGSGDEMEAGEDREESPKPSAAGKAKDRRPANRTERPNYVGNKGKLQRDRRKLREKRRSTGVVHLQSTEVGSPPPFFFVLVRSQFHSLFCTFLLRKLEGASGFFIPNFLFSSRIYFTDQWCLFLFKKNYFTRGT